MRSIDKPEYDTKLVYEDCVNGIGDDNLKNKLLAITSFIVDIGNDYDTKAKIENLFFITPKDYKDEDIVFDNVNKKELTNLYTQYMVGSKKNAREIYDKLLGKAPRGKCPFCGFGQAATLDHYLPKSKFPFFSVLPLNLIPACRDCNSGAKKTKLAVTTEQQVIHPYYDQKLLSEQWLFAKIIASPNPDSILIEFFVKPPEYWDDISKERVKTHFRDFELSRRFSIEANDELASLNHLFDINVKEHFNSIAKAEYDNHKNSWRTAMYQALAKSDWYCCLVSKRHYLYHKTHQ